jgi:hypothetical protein
MFTLSRPDVTNEGWHTWPTEEVSHVLARRPQIRSALHEHLAEAVAGAQDEVAAFKLAPSIRRVVEAAVREGEVPELRERLITYALSRVDWLQLAEALVEAASPEALEEAA